MDQLKTTIEVKYDTDEANKAISDLMNRLDKELSKLEENHEPLEEKLILNIEYEMINKNRDKDELIDELLKENKELKESIQSSKCYDH